MEECIAKVVPALNETLESLNLGAKPSGSAVAAASMATASSAATLYMSEMGHVLLVLTRLKRGKASGGTKEQAQIKSRFAVPITFEPPPRL